MKKGILYFFVVICLVSFVIPLQTVITAPSSTSLFDREDFLDGKTAPWELYVEPHAMASAEVVDVPINTGQTKKAVCITVIHPGYNTWDIQFRYRGLPLVKGQTYTYEIQIGAEVQKPVKIHAQLGQPDLPYKTYKKTNIQFPSSITGGIITDQVTMNSDYPQGELAFHLSCKNMVPRVRKNYYDREEYKIYIFGVKLTNPKYKRPAVPKPISAIRLNRNGYTPNGKKIALLVSKSSNSQPWTLFLNRVGTVASGYTRYRGKDRYSGDYLHEIDFSNYKKRINGYDLKLKVAGLSSDSFEIKGDIYKRLTFDAMKFFYHQRSGIALEKKYLYSSYSSMYGKWVRPAGHVGDKAVPVAEEYAKAFLKNPSHYSPYGGKIVNKGWYDAGDHGKYVVNGGLALWIMQNQFERMKIRNSPLLSLFSDSHLKIPESGNGIPDILDEARWEMEMLLAMQVSNPRDPKYGMVHHKLHDNKWTEVPKTPADATQQSIDKEEYQRVVYPPTTAATLNLVATATQSARLWKSYDKAFANKCLRAAELAWQAALKYPNITTQKIQLRDILYPGMRPVLRPDLGGGFYEDDNMGDEFYWAACELYFTTSNNTIKQQCLNYITNTGYLGKISGLPHSSGHLGGPFDWRETEALGTIALATMAGSPYQSQARNSIIQYADKVLNILNTSDQIYPAPMTSWWWGSNSTVLNRAMIMAYAYDFTGNRDYLQAIARCVDYLMG
ncbi:MAG: hypothetical protein GXY86_09940, partial [Firmicutes bacterium]|nr:hypothetical protein [Bacillota bacterium]